MLTFADIGAFRARGHGILCPPTLGVVSSVRPRSVTLVHGLRLGGYCAGAILRGKSGQSTSLPTVGKWRKIRASVNSSMVPLRVVPGVSVKSCEVMEQRVERSFHVKGLQVHRTIDTLPSGATVGLMFDEMFTDYLRLESKENFIKHLKGSFAFLPAKVGA